MSEALKAKKEARKSELFSQERFRSVLYRPFSRRILYESSLMIDRLSYTSQVFPNGVPSPAISASIGSPTTAFIALATDRAVDFHCTGESRAVARYRYTEAGERIDNITDWALNIFVKHYGRKGVTKDTIFHYVYGVLHDPLYREAYALNLKREFPRIPFYPDFVAWSARGKALMALHINYETVAPWPVERIETPGRRAVGTHPSPILKSKPEAGVVMIDSDTQIASIPLEAWSYRLGNRSAIDWVLDQHKEKRPRDQTIAARFNTYRFADHKESMIALLAKVVRVSLETADITTSMAAIDRSL